LLQGLVHILRMIKFEHTLFALPLAYVGALMAAKGWPGWHNALLILLAMGGARSAAMSFNRIVDLPFDKANPRTRNRELPSGRLSRGAVMAFLWISCAIFFLSAWALGPWCFYLSPVALVVILGYSYTKRFTWACHIFLGLALSLAPLGGYLAVAGSLDWAVVVLALGVLFWVAGFDLIYACQDIEFDRKVGLQSIPAKMGAQRALWLSGLFHALCVILFVLAGWMSRMPWPYFAGTALVGGLLIWEHRIVFGVRLDQIDLAFFTINSYVSVTLLCGVAFSALLLT